MVGAVVLGLVADRRYAQWRRQADEARAYAAEQLARADAAEQRADSLSEAAAALAVAASRRDTVLRERIRVVMAEPVPPDCSTYTAPRDSLIRDLQLQANQWRAAYETQREAQTSLYTAYVRARAAADSLSITLANAPRVRSLWVPRPSLFAGLCVDGRPCAGVGLAWSIPWPK